MAFWFASVLLSLLPTIKAYLRARRAVKRDEPKTELAAAQASASLVRAGCDLVVSSSYAINADVIPPLYSTHDGLVGIAGAVSGAVGFYQAWTK